LCAPESDLPQLINKDAETQSIATATLFDRSIIRPSSGTLLLSPIPVHKPVHKRTLKQKRHALTAAYVELMNF
jgi:hypothetical protein